jgi:hypothetical protein
MGAWDFYIGGSATGDPEYMNNNLAFIIFFFCQKQIYSGLIAGAVKG